VDDTTASHPGRELAVVRTACREIVGRACAETQILSAAADTVTARVKFACDDRLVIKLWFGSSRSHAVREAWVYRNCSHVLAIGMPKLLASGEIDAVDASVLFFTDVGDVTLGRAVEVGEYTPDGAVDVLGQQIAELHGPGSTCLTFNGGSPLTTRLIDQEVDRQLAHLTRAGLGALCQPLRKYYRQYSANGIGEQPARLCHGDIHAKNVVLGSDTGKGRAAYLVDFESAVYAQAEYDVAKCVVTNSLFSARMQSRLASSYTPAVSVDTELTNVWTVFHAVDGWFYAGVREGRDRSLWNARMQWALDRYTGGF
jgi:Phosphotransferase enzyme family